MGSIEIDKHFPQAISRLEKAIGEDERQKLPACQIIG